MPHGEGGASRAGLCPWTRRRPQPALPCTGSSWETAALAKLIVRDRDQTALLDLRPDEQIVVGRSHDCDLPVSAPRASRHHAEIVPAPAGGHLLRDLGSTNGTLLNGAPFPDEASLGDGDIIDVGGCLITRNCFNVNLEIIRTGNKRIKDIGRQDHELSPDRQGARFMHRNSETADCARIGGV